MSSFSTQTLSKLQYQNPPPTNQSTWSRHTDSIKSHTVRGGLDVLCSGIVVVALGSALAFAVYARQYHYYLALETFDSAIINVSNLASFVSFAGTIIAALWASGLTIVAGRWLLGKVEDPQSKCKVGHWSAMASHGSLKFIRYWITIPGLVVALMTSWAIPAVLSGALVPTIGTASGTVQAYYFRIAGAQTDPTDGVMTSCYAALQGDFPFCPGSVSHGDILSAMRNALLGTYPYTVGGFSQATATGIAGQYNLPAAWQKLAGKSLRSGANTIATTACVPTVIPSTRCQIIHDPAGITSAASTISYSDICTDDAVDLTGMDVAVNGCFASKETFRLYYNLFGDLALITGSNVATRVECDMAALETDQLTRYDRASNRMSLSGDCGRTTALDIDDLPPLTSSVVYVLRTSPYTNGITTLTAPIVNTLLQNKSGPIEDMLSAGLTAAGQAIYLAALPQSEGGGNMNASLTASTTAGLSSTMAEVSFRVYGWGFGSKGLGWIAGLGVCIFVALAVTCMGLFVRRLRYDPADFRQTVVIALGSNLGAPENTSTGQLPESFNREELRYGQESTGVFGFSKM